MEHPTPRITPGTRRDLGLVNHVISIVAGRAIGGHRPNVFTTLGRQRRLFRAWLFYSAHLMPGGRLARTETELVILRVAATRGCEYESNHHRRIGRRVGLTAEQIAHADDPTWSGWDDRQRSLLVAAGHLVTDRGLDDATWADLRRHLDEAEAIEFLMLCGQYDSLATTLLTLRVQPEPSPR
ncbi:alkylhydroperoxidase AhpD family core domain protein [Aeromicrobium marinum DSM 15272]|uniref:Alkylhydroperoxidase AhpD family core domain protein n=1 Tax=Aeromicrobium marinum DSM 15272 TaxID=585531 RepID=E2SAL0_9ACTN|nr:carboxymuconolactone decarboxylase family protein [Aeromicrobium marinum]EFQ83406.1 alkylhydroperoxidase AhpD family core domain protein [Aeromicrobium marinum DSM 15272]